MRLNETDNEENWTLEKPKASFKNEVAHRLSNIKPENFWKKVHKDSELMTKLSIVKYKKTAPELTKDQVQVLYEHFGYPYQK